MARQKSEQVRQAILDAAHTLFTEKGYIATTISAIARSANTSQSNVYVYFASKIEIAFAVFDPWMRAKMIELESNVGATRGAEAKLEAMVTGLLNGIAADHSGQTLTLVQALATAKPTDNYSSTLLNWTMERLRVMIADAVPASTADEREALAQALMLAFDGVALRQNLRRGEIQGEPSTAAFHHLFQPMIDRATAKEPART
ncbi:TetR/AcrR family transcriptional regulator [Albibacillus kandeliae]|uniref:TetR/AcrR family transcriptional regulator n=1 Tax=Albibacillus kandeliae TaxID=2174228 RepID=UPI000D68B9A5|nr:TetR/AcrR family transcriptional regulator [Albibacillus kandeliae]